MSEVEFTQIEFDWLHRNVNKLDKMPLLGQKARETISYLRPVIERAIENNSRKIALSRRDKQVLQGIIKNILTVLEESVIVRYRERNMQEYLVNAQNKAKMLSGLRRKLR